MILQPVSTEHKTIYFSGLNGLRAIGAIAVVLSHITLDLERFGLDPYIFGAFKDGTPQGLNLGGYGVSIFFVLSGFLITYLLQTEKDVQEINTKKFYMRRILRIWPLYYLYLAIAVFVILMYGFELKATSLFFYIFYAANIPFILQTTLSFVGHYWSLGVEEQFYIFWPYINKKVNNNFIFKIFIAILILVGTKLTLHFLYPNSILESAIHVTRFHCMLIGAAGAIWYKEKNLVFLKLINNQITQSISWLIIFLVAINKFHLASVIDNEIICLVALCLIIGQVEIKNRILNLENNVCDFLGKISYGIYVIHPILIFFLAKPLNSIPVNGFLKYVIVYSSVLMITIFCAYISYTYFERYFMNLKKKFVVVESSPTRLISPMN